MLYGTIFRLLLIDIFNIVLYIPLIIFICVCGGGVHLCFPGEWCQTPVNRPLSFQIIEVEFSSSRLKKFYETMKNMPMSKHREMFLI